jgi:hypothetical protein
MFSDIQTTTEEASGDRKAARLLYKKVGEPTTSATHGANPPSMTLAAMLA